MPTRPSLNAEQLQVLRLGRCDSQASLAARAEMSERTVRRLELGQTSARLSTIRKLAAALEVSIEQLTEVA
jgi:transcriptional regulator with XRE-family HTH domain